MHFHLLINQNSGVSFKSDLFIKTNHLGWMTCTESLPENICSFGLTTLNLFAQCWTSKLTKKKSKGKQSIVLKRACFPKVRDSSVVQIIWTNHFKKQIQVICVTKISTKTQHLCLHLRSQKQQLYTLLLGLDVPNTPTRKTYCRNENKTGNDNAEYKSKMDYNEL